MLTGCGDDQTQLKDPGSSNNTDAATGPDAGGMGQYDAGEEDSSEPPPPPGVPSAVETTLQTQNPQLGESIEVGCQMLDQNGNPVSPEEQPEWELVYSPRESFEDDSETPLTLLPQQMGDARVGCAASNYSLVDGTPVEFTVAPGPPHTVRTSLDNSRVEAGTEVQASCRVFDEFGNELNGVDTSVDIDAMGSGISVDDHSITVEKTGLYSVTCGADAAEREVPTTLEITPGPAASLTMTPEPRKSIYGLGEVVHFSTVVTDEFGNKIPDAQVAHQINPSANQFGRARWEFNQEGTYNISAEVTGQTQGGMTLETSTEITVNGEGPSIQCDSPSHASTVDAAPGDPVKLTGTVQDAHDVDSLTVDGNSVNVGSGGSFSTNLDTRYGINFVDITATDSYGEQNSRTCAFLIADNWHTEGNFLSDAVTLYLGQDALDDGYASNLYNSLMDVVDQVLNSDGLLDEIDSLLRPRNPLVSGCFDYLVGCEGYELNYIRRSNGSPGLRTDSNDVSMDWTYSGMDLGLTINDLGVRMHAKTDNVCNEKGWVDIDQVDVDLSVDLDISNGQPSASVQKSQTSVNVGTVNPNFSGGCGWVIDRIEGLGAFQDAVQGEIKTQLRKAINDNIDDVLDDLFNSLDVSRLNSTFSVPKLAGSGNVPIDFNVRFSSLGTTTSRALIGLGTKFEAANRQNAISSNGIPLPAGSVHREPNTSEEVAGAVHVGVLNYALNALWRGGLFDAQLGSSLLGSGAPSGTKANLTVDLPPVARRLGNGDVEMMLGGATVELEYPGLFDDPIEFQVGLVASTGVNLQGSDRFNFRNVTIEEFYFSPVGVKLDSDSRQVISSFLRDLFQNVVDQSLNSALPALPIPSFTIPSSMGKFGLPVGQELGLRSASLDGTDSHFILEGSFGKK
jgi:hypothetical protein